MTSIKNIDVYYIISLIYKDGGISYKDISKILNDNKLSEYEYKWSANIRRCSIPDVSSYPIKEKKFIYDEYNKKYFPLKSYILDNLQLITCSIEVLLNKKITSTFFNLLTNLLSDIKNNKLVMVDKPISETNNDKYLKTGKGERQKHGFDYQEVIIKKYNMVESSNYTAEWDSPLFNDMPVSIKCCKKGGEIAFGDVFRQINVNENFLIFVGWWDKDKHVMVEEYIVKIDINIWKSYFGNINNLYDMKKEMSEISNDHSDDDKWKLFCEKWKKIYKDNNNPIISLRFKRDHKTQKRIQCAITYNNFINILLNDHEIIQY